MLMVLQKQVRPSTEVNFFIPKQSPNVDPATLAYIFENYISTGKMLFTNYDIDESDLELTIQQLWQTAEDYESFRTDPIIVSGIHDVAKDHRIANNITLEITTQEV